MKRLPASWTAGGRVNATPSSSSFTIFFASDGRSCGPYPIGLLLELVRGSGNPAEALVREGASGPWSRLGDVPVLAATLAGHAVPDRAAPPRVAVRGSGKPQMTVTIEAQHRRQEQDLRVEPLIDLTLHETMQNEGNQNRCYDQCGGDEHASANHQTSA